MYLHHIDRQTDRHGFMPYRQIDTQTQSVTDSFHFCDRLSACPTLYRALNWCRKNAFSSVLSCQRYTHTHTYMYAYIHARIHVCIHARTDTYMHTCTRTYIHAYIHAHMHACILSLTHTYMHTSTHTHLHAYKHAHTLACRHSFMYNSEVQVVGSSYREHILQRTHSIENTSIYVQL